jgi:Peptidase inhibitor family I36
MLAVTMVGAAGTPAQAVDAASWDECWIGYACIWDGINSAGGILFAINGRAGTCVNVPASANDRAESFYNKLIGSGRAIQLYQHANCTGIQLRRQANGSAGPFFSGVRDSIYRDSLITHRNKLTSIWFNTCNPTTQDCS